MENLNLDLLAICTNTCINKYSTQAMQLTLPSHLIAILERVQQHAIYRMSSFSIVRPWQSKHRHCKKKTQVAEERNERAQQVQIQNEAYPIHVGYATSWLKESRLLVDWKAVKSLLRLNNQNYKACHPFSPVQLKNN